MEKRVFKLVVSIVAILMALNTNAQVSFYIEDFIIEQDKKEKEVLVYMTNEPSNITGIQMDIYMPEGLSILSDEIGYYIELGSRTSSRKHTLESALQKDGAVRIVCASSKLYPFSGNEGDVLILTIVADEKFGGTGVIELKNCVATGANTDGSGITQYKPSDSFATVKYDTSGVEWIVGNNSEPVYYNLLGTKVSDPENGIFLKVHEGKVSKIVRK